MYLRDNASGSYLPLVTEANVAPGVQFGGKRTSCRLRPTSVT